MADAHLRICIGFAKSAAERLVIKKRIVPKSICSALLVDYPAFYRASKKFGIPAVVDERYHAYESCGAILYAAKLVEEPFVGEVRGVHAGAAAERVHFDSGIVDE